jgi:hypothetical protein
VTKTATPAVSNTVTTPATKASSTSATKNVEVAP